MIRLGSIQCDLEIQGVNRWHHEIVQGWVSPSYGVKEPAPVLRVALEFRNSLCLKTLVRSAEVSALISNRMGNPETFQPIHDPTGATFVDSPLVSDSQAITSTIWSVVGRFGSKAVAIVSSVILARLLTPEDFGLFRLAGVITGFVVIFGDVGVGSALIYKQAHLKKMRGRPSL